MSKLAEIKRERAGGIHIERVTWLGGTAWTASCNWFYPDGERGPRFEVSVVAVRPCAELLSAFDRAARAVTEAAVES